MYNPYQRSWLVVSIHVFYSALFKQYGLTEMDEWNVFLIDSPQFYEYFV